MARRHDKALAVGDSWRRGFEADRARRSRRTRRSARAGLERGARGRRTILGQGGTRGRRGRGRGRDARGRSLLQRRARQRAHRAGRSRARRRDHGRPQPQRGRRRGPQDHARADQPRAAADGARPARLPAGQGADRFAASAGIEQVANDCFILPERRRQLDEAAGRGQRRRPDQIWHGRRGRGRLRRPCRGGHLDRRDHRQALGPGRRFAADRRRHLCRRPLRRRLRDGLGRIFHSRGRRAPACRAGAARRASRCSRRSTRCSPTSPRSAARAG